MADTPSLVIDLTAIEKAYLAFTTSIRPGRTYYAVKCNPPGVVQGKFGVGPGEAVDLLLMARHLGLRPYGITLHVGSQTIRPDAWITPIRHGAEIMREPRTFYIQLSMLEIGGGNPATYNKVLTGIGEDGNFIAAALHEYLPYEIEVVAEPGLVCSPC
jgi:diaminopimelate decarboxylase